MLIWYLHAQPWKPWLFAHMICHGYICRNQISETKGIYAKKFLHRFPWQSMHANKQCFRLHLQIPTSQGNLAIVHTLHGIYAGNPTNIDNRNFTEFSSLYWFSAHVLWKKSCLDQYVSVSPSEVKEFLSSYQRKRVTFELEIPLWHLPPNVYRIIPKLFSKARSCKCVAD